MYFLLITVLQCIPSISISNGQPAMLLPLLVVIMVSMVKDAFEDYKRSLNDKRENESKLQCFDPDIKNFGETEWQKLKVGNIVKVNEDQFIPVDMVLLYSTGPKGTCYVETKNLDGETNLKLKQIQKDLQGAFSS